MGSIPKTLLIPIKWASKQVLNRTLLRFPGGNAHDPIACTYCPEMCRFSCPTAVASGNDAVTPCNKMGLLHRESRWPGVASGGGPLWPIYDCTGCGRCTEYCVYEMPVAQQLFAARAKYSWHASQLAAEEITDAMDPTGSLAFELGDAANAERRFHTLAPDVEHEFAEPNAVYFASRNGAKARLSWEKTLKSPLSSRLRELLGKGEWLVHESVWFNRRMNRWEDALGWAQRAQSEGARLVLPFHHGKDCIDCGGESAYSLTHRDEAATMARSWWERDRHRAIGILCFSASCARHFRKVLGDSVPVLSLAEG